MPSLIFLGPFWAFFAKFPEKSHFFIKNGVFGHVRLKNGPPDPSRTMAKKSIRNFEPSRAGCSCALADPDGLPAARAAQLRDPGERMASAVMAMLKNGGRAGTEYAVRTVPALSVMLTDPRRYKAVGWGYLARAYMGRVSRR